MNDFKYIITELIQQKVSDEPDLGSIDPEVIADNLWDNKEVEEAYLSLVTELVNEAIEYEKFRM